MATKQFTMATLAGGVAVFLMGFLLHGLVLADFFAANGGTATGVMKEAPIMWSLAIGQVVFAGFLVAIMGWRGDASVGAGLKTGAIVGLVMGLGIDFTMYGVTNVSNLTATLVDPIIFAIQLGVGGAVIGAVLGMGSTAAAPAAASAPAPIAQESTQESTQEPSAGM